MPHPKRSERGLLTPGDCIVAPTDLQPQALFDVSICGRQTIVDWMVVLAKAARGLNAPIVPSTCEIKGVSGELRPQLKAVAPDEQPAGQRSPRRTVLNSEADLPSQLEEVFRL
jgi:hypothetical protein